MVSSSSDDESSGQSHTGEQPVAQHAGVGSKHETSDKASVTGTSRVPQPIFSFVLAPKVSSIARDELVEWLKLRKEYEEAVKERCKDGKEDIKVMKSIRNSIDNDLLETLCEVNWGVAKDDLTDEFLLKQIHAITDSYQNQVLPPVNELFQKELQMDMSNKDITSRVTNYFMLCNTLIKKYGFSSFFDEEKGMEKKCKLLVNSLPDTLKERVRNEIDYRFPEAPSNVRKLYKLICQQALAEAIEHRALAKERSSARKQKNQEKSQSFRKNKRLHVGEHKKSEKVQRKVEQSDAKNSRKKHKKEQSSSKGAPKTGCFHCGGAHYLSGCPTATKEDRERLTTPTQKKKSGEPPAGRHR